MVTGHNSTISYDPAVARTTEISKLSAKTGTHLVHLTIDRADAAESNQADGT